MTNINRRNYHKPLTFQFAREEPSMFLLTSSGLQLKVCVFLFQGLTVCLDPKRVQGCLDSVAPITMPGIGYTGHLPHSPPLHSGPNLQMPKEAALQTVTTERETGNEKKRKNESEKRGTLLLGKMRKIRTGWCCKSTRILVFVHILESKYLVFSLAEILWIVIAIQIAPLRLLLRLATRSAA